MTARESFEARLLGALSESEDWDDVGSRLRATVGEDEIDEARPFVFAFAYRLLEPRDVERRQVSGSAFGVNGQDFPPPLGAIDEATLDVWANYAGRSDDPIVLSRFHDLLWERRHGEYHLHARLAGRAYLDLAIGSWTPLNRSFCAIRALELGRSINDSVLIGEVINVCIALAREDLNSDEWSPGVGLRLIERLVELPPEVRPDATVELVRQAGERYGRDPFIAESVAELRAAISPVDQRELVWRVQVQRWRDAADEAGGLVGYAHRQRALELALNHGLVDLADAIRVDLQSMSSDDLDFKEFSADISFTAAEMETYLAEVVAGDTWQEALSRFGIHGPPTGQAETNETAARQTALDFPLRGLVPTQVIGAHRALIFHAVTDEERHHLERIRQEGFGLLVFAPLAVRALNRVVERFGIPAESELATFLGRGAIEADLTRRLAQALGYYWRGDYDAAGHLLAPRIEAAIRHLCVAIGIPVTKPPRGQNPGGVLTLGALLDDLEGRMNESWRRYLVHLLTDQLALNLRNDISHGLIPEVDQYKAALLVHAACHIAAVQITDG